jgi:hypothetical protein
VNAWISLGVQGRFLESPTFDGAQLYQALEDLDSLAQQLNLEPLGSFIAVTDEEIEDVGIDLMDFMMPQTEWFEAEDILETVFDLRVHLEKQPDAIPNSTTVLPELKLLELALEKCETSNLAVRLTLEV